MGRKKPLVLNARVGLVVALAAAALGLVVRPCWAVDYYRWVDERGLAHYSNAPSEVPPGKVATRISMKQTPISSGPAGSEVGAGADEEIEEEVEPGAEGQGVAPPGSAVGGGKGRRQTSAELSLARYQLERELDEIGVQVAEIDRRLGTLAKLRMQHAHRSHPSVGGLLAVGAADVRSPEEEALEERRKGLTKRIEEIRSGLAGLPAK